MSTDNHRGSPEFGLISPRRETKSGVVWSWVLPPKVDRRPHAGNCSVSPSTGLSIHPHPRYLTRATAPLTCANGGDIEPPWWTHRTTQRRTFFPPRRFQGARTRSLSAGFGRFEVILGACQMFLSADTPPGQTSRRVVQ
jgi:hypothetical protein